MAAAVVSPTPAATALNSRFSMDDQSSLASSFRWLPPRIGTRTAEPSLRSVKRTTFARPFKRSGKQRSVTSSDFVDEGTGLQLQQCALSSASVPDLTLLNSKQKNTKKRSRLCEMETHAEPGPSTTRSKKLLNRLTAITRLKSHPTPPPPLPTPSPALRSEAQQEALKAFGLVSQAQTVKPRDEILPTPSSSQPIPPQRPPRPDGVSPAGAIIRDWQEKESSKKPGTAEAEFHKFRTFKFGGSKVDLSSLPGPPGLITTEDSEILLPPQALLAHDDSASIKSRRGMQDRLAPLDFSKSSAPSSISQVKLAQSPSRRSIHHTASSPGSPPGYRTVKNTSVVPLSPGLLFDACSVPLPSSPDGVDPNPALDDLCLFPLPPTPISSSSSPPNSYMNSLPGSRSHSPEPLGPLLTPGAIPSPSWTTPESQSLSPTISTPTLSICQTFSTASVFSPSPSSATFEIRAHQDHDAAHAPTIRENLVRTHSSPFSAREIDRSERPDGHIPDDLYFPPILTPIRRHTELAPPIPEDKTKKRRKSVVASFGTLRRSVVGSLSSKSAKSGSRMLSPSPARSPIDISQLPPSPSLPAEFCRSPTSPGFATSPHSPLSPTLQGSERGRPVMRSNSRMAVDPRIHSNTALLVELEAMKSSTNDEETQRLSELAFFG